ncbi:ABC transporter permease, partial [Streptomyces sp. SID7982]|nr:ABC transporter permease [Streptomyces sp. SID7982]
MSTATAKTEPEDVPLAAPDQERLSALLVGQARPPRPSALSASMAFGWRAVLKIKHVPEQLFDVTAFP